MSNEPLQDLQNRVHEAVEWHQKLKRGELDRCVHEHLRAWLRTTENVQELARIALLDSLLQETSRKRHKSTQQINVIDFKPDTDLPRSEDTENPHADPSLPLSVFYLQDFRKNNLWAKVAVATAAFLAIALALWMDSAWLAPGIACMLCLGAILGKEAIVSYRVKCGSFGSTESEVRELIRFIVENCQSDDFTDSSGRRRPALAKNPRNNMAHSDHLPIGARTR